LLKVVDKCDEIVKEINNNVKIDDDDEEEE